MYASPGGENSLLEVRELAVGYTLDGKETLPALRGVSCSIRAGECVGLLGESGSGKTTFGAALLRLLPVNARILSGSANFSGRDLFRLSETQLEQVRGAQLSVIFQEPGIALHPMLRVGDQIADVIRVHRGGSKARCREQAEEALSLVRLDDTVRIYSAYPHELSGGQQQRVLIALALCCRPSLVVADEPTASLDATVQAEILSLLRELQKELRLSLLWISHNPAVLAQVAQRILVLYAGRIVEEGPVERVLSNPLHPYTFGLLQSLPASEREDASEKATRLRTLAGNPADPSRLARGCAFEPRCPDRRQECTEREPDPVEPEPSRRVRCFKYGG